ncbi:hypothetical protein Taro_055456 [Colocasia esculenta]|uniref:Uncharacterized protein n=1 Tax=Colocasia esculenta TaxID=4460 RepID=A0A843XRC2_COLES|nr:hypothetical protein [Colocasia esculenta]
MDYRAPAEILANYYPYHQMMGHSIKQPPNGPANLDPIRISKEAAAKPISQQAEEFMDHYHSHLQLLKKQLMQPLWMGHCRPSKSASSKRVNNSTVRGGSNKRSISESSSEQKVISSLKALYMKKKSCPICLLIQKKRAKVPMPHQMSRTTLLSFQMESC